METKGNDPAIENVFAKVSCCGNCGGIVRAAVEHMMDLKSKNDFAREVMKYNLSVKSIQIEKYRSALTDGTLTWCECKPDTHFENRK